MGLGKGSGQVSPALRYAIWPKLGSPTALLLSGGSAAASAPPSVPGEPASRGALIALDSKCVSGTWLGLS